MTMYSATISNGTMHASKIESVRHDDHANDIYESVMTGHTVIIDTDINRLEAMADQMGLAFVVYPEIAEGTIRGQPAHNK